MAVILDSDMLSILQRRSQPACARLETRLSELRDDEVCSTNVSYEEQMRGWLEAIRKARTGPRLVLMYAELQGMLRDYCHLDLLPFDATAHSIFNELRRQKIRIGTMDLRIASIALSTQSTLLSRNLRDFERVPGLDVEDWSS